MDYVAAVQAMTLAVLTARFSEDYANSAKADDWPVWRDTWDEQKVALEAIKKHVSLL